MITKGEYIYGTLKECVDELWKRIDWKNRKFPDFDYAAFVGEDERNIDEVRHQADGWFGCKDVGNLYNADTFTLIFAHYSGGGVESMELWNDDDTDRKQMLIDRIGNSTDLCGYGILDPNDYTLFEIITE